MQMIRPYFGEAELEAVHRVLRSGQWAQGKEVSALEQEFSRGMNIPHAVAMNSGTASLWAALHGIGIGPGMEVVVPAFSFAASANCVLYVGARPVFVDVEESTGNMDLTHLERVLQDTPKVKAIVVVHLYGHPAPMSHIMDLARHYQLVVVEDCAQALGASWEQQPVGTWGHAGCFSFYATKQVACGEGGMTITRDKVLAHKLRRFINHGQARRYEHLTLGYNLRMSDIHAALARVQLRRLPHFLSRRQDIAGHYHRFIAHREIKKPPWAEKHAWHLYTIQSSKRSQLVQHLEASGIPSAIHYPIPLPGQPLYTGLGYQISNYPMASQLAGEVLSLPLHPGLEHNDLRQVIQVVNSFSS